MTRTASRCPRGCGSISRTASSAPVASTAASSVWSPGGWDDYVNTQGDRLDGFSREGRLMQRYLFGGALHGELDRQGRVALPAPLLQHAQLSKDIVIAGLRDRLEIWDREAWRRQLAEVEGSAESVAERLAQSKP